MKPTDDVTREMIDQPTIHDLIENAYKLGQQRGAALSMDSVRDVIERLDEVYAQAEALVTATVPTPPFDANLAFALSCGSLRYGLGRHSYAVAIIVDAITERLPLFAPNNLVWMRQELEHSLRHDLAGEDEDRDRWAGLLEKIRDEEGRR